MSRKKIRKPAQDREATPSTPAPAREIQGEDAILAWLRQGNVRTFRYKVNKPGFIFLAILALFAAVGALALLMRSGLALAIHWAGFSVLMGFTTWCMWIISRWMFFAHRNYIALTDHELMIGYAQTGLVIPRSRINTATLGVERMQKGRISVTIPLEVDGHRRDLHLFGPFANLEYIEPFIEEMLHDIKRQEGDSPQAPEDDFDEEMDSAADGEHDTSGEENSAVDGDADAMMDDADPPQR